jgi:hypothetical protein
MLGGQIFVCLLMKYYLRKELRSIGQALQSAYGRAPDAPQFGDCLEDLLETLIERTLKNQGLLDRDFFEQVVPQWYSSIHNFKKVNREIVQVNMF